MIRLYGIKNCDTVQKARKWLDQHQVSYEFHDFRADGMDSVPVDEWINTLGWEKVLNKRSTSWRALSDEQKTGMDDTLAAACAQKEPTLIKRPVLTMPGKTPAFGFKPADYEAHLA